MGSDPVTVRYVQEENGFLKQENPKKFEYSIEYKQKQGTNVAMSWLRIGWLLSYIPSDKLSTMHAVDIGSGNGVFAKEAGKVFRSVSSYDVVGYSISKTELYTRHWDILFMTDVLEHFDNIDEFWNLNFDFAFISYPERPTNTELTNWRHNKPDEHLYVLDRVNFKNWVERHGCTFIGYGYPEDAIRKRWDREQINISTFLIQRKSYVS